VLLYGRVMPEARESPGDDEPEGPTLADPVLPVDAAPVSTDDADIDMPTLAEPVSAMARAAAPEAPALPEVHDEAGDTPWWVPVLGLVLAVLVVALLVWRAKTAEPTPEQQDAPEAQAPADSPDTPH